MFWIVQNAQSGLGFIVYAVSTVLAFWFPVAALTINLLLWIVWITLSINAKSD